MEKVADYVLLLFPLLIASSDGGRCISGSLRGRKVYYHHFTDKECQTQPHFSSAMVCISPDSLPV